MDNTLFPLPELSEQHQSRLPPQDNKFHVGNGDDGKHYWLTPPDVYDRLNSLHGFDFDPCPFPKPDDFDGLTAEWGRSNYVNPPFGSIIHEGKKKGMTAWVRKAIAEQQKGKRVVMVYPLDKWVLMLVAAGAKISNLGDVKWLATEDGSEGRGTGRHIACFVLEPGNSATSAVQSAIKALRPVAEQAVYHEDVNDNVAANTIPTHLDLSVQDLRNAADALAKLVAA
jgi:hypothetical protein